jgi:hypothetical protein
VNCQLSKSHIATDGQSTSKSWCRAPSGVHDHILTTLWQLRSCFCGVLSLTRGRVCLLYMLLALASVVILGSESLGTRDHILLSQIWDFQIRRLLRFTRSRWRYSNPPPHGCELSVSQSQSYVTTDCLSANLSWNKAPELSVEAEAEPKAEAKAEAYCRQPAGTLTPGIGPRWDPWPYICSMSRPLFCFLLLFLLIDKGGVGLIYIDWCPLTTPYSTWGYFFSLPGF